MGSKNLLKHKKKAFTLIELLIVIAIIGILFIVLVSRVDFATDKAKVAGVQTDFRSFQVALDTVARENAGFNMFGFNTGDNAGAIPSGYVFETEELRKATMGDGKRNSYDSGDKNLNGKEDAGEVFNGHKIHTEKWTDVYTLIKPGTTYYDPSAIFELQTAINANLDPKLHINIDTNGNITMANQARDPWKNEYSGVYISNASHYEDSERGAIVMFSAGPNGVLNAQATMNKGVVSIVNPNADKLGQDDLAIASCYTYFNGYGEVKNVSIGFSVNQSYLGNTDATAPEVVPGDGGVSNDNGSGGPGEGGYTMVDMPNGTVTVASPIQFRSEADFEKFVRVKVDGKNVPYPNASVSEGSTIITLNGGYLSTLSDGIHEIEIVSTDGSAKATFNVVISCRDHYDRYYYGDDEYDYYDGDDSRCDICGIVYCYYNYCLSLDDDCNCDWCGWDNWDCHNEDETVDGYCDRCGEIVACYFGGPCISAPGECYCWNCGTEDHSDTNTDGYCDICERIFHEEGGPCHVSTWGCFCEWCYDDMHHWSDTGCYCTMCYYEEHCDDDPIDGYCDVCNYEGGCHIGGPCIWNGCYTVCCGDYNHYGYEDDGICDACNEVNCYDTGVHGSTDSNCWCDCCGEVQVHKNNNNDCACDFCGTTMHHDDDKNGYCNGCNIVYCEDSGSCIDETGDCSCDWCSLPAHINDGTGFCPACNNVYCDGKSISTAYILTLGQSCKVIILTSGSKVYCKFTATTAGTYTFYSDFDGDPYSKDPYGYLYDSLGNAITQNDDYEGYNFSITRTLAAGETVYVGAALWSDRSGESYNLYVEQN